MVARHAEAPAASSTWIPGGVGYSYIFRRDEPAHAVKAFWEQCLFYVPPISVGYRTEYLHDLGSGIHYLRPSLGLSLFFLDLFYNYAFPLNGDENLFGHGISLRLKYFLKTKNWEKRYPSSC